MPHRDKKDKMRDEMPLDTALMAENVVSANAAALSLQAGFR
jgi:hypothetical protein